MIATLSALEEATKEPPECGLGGLSRKFCGLNAD